MKTRKLALLALVLGMASCQKDFAPGFLSEGEVGVKLSVVAPDLLTATRTDGGAKANLDSAYGAIDYLDGSVAGDDRFDWNDVDLRYSLEVYDAEDLEEPIKDRMVIIKDKYEPVMFDLRLIPGREYQFAIFADFVPQGEAVKEVDYSVQGDLGLRHTIGDYLTDITIKQGVDALNDEVADAYFKSFKYTPDDNTYNSVKDIVLTRPYAKLRVVATDLADLNLNVHPKYVTVKYDSEVVIPTTFNAVTGSIAGDKVVENKTLNFEYVDEIRDNRSNHTYNADNDAKTTIADNGAVRASHLTLFTDYILAVGGEHTPISFTMTVEDAAGETIKKVEFNTQIPIERNFLTTIVGNVLTTETEVEISIKDDFYGEIVKNANFANNVDELQYAIDNTIEGDNVIVITGDIEGDITLPQVQGKNLVIDGDNHKFDGTILVVGNNGSTQTDTLVIKNFNFTSEKDEIDFIQQNSQNAPGRYAHNITIEGCTFNGNANAVGMRFRQCYNITVKDCVMESGHSLAQFVSCTGIYVDGVEVKAGRGIALGTSKDCVVKNATIEADSYGLRAEPTSTLLVENSTIKAAQPIVVRKLTSGTYAVTFAGVNTLNPTTDGDYQVVFTNGDDSSINVIPEGVYEINDENQFKVFPRNIAEGVQDTMAIAGVNGINAFATIVNAGYTFEGKTVLVEKNIDLKGVEFEPIGTAENVFSGVFDGQNKTISNLVVENEGNGAMFAYVGANTVIKNLNLKDVDVKAKYAAALLAEANDNVAVENITVSGNVNGTAYAAGVVCLNSYSADPSISIKDCTNNATITSQRAGGIGAWVTANSTIENVVNNGDITGSISAAGITNRVGGTVKNAVNYGTIVGNGTEASSGIAGTSTAVANFEYCYNYGNVTTTTDNPNSSAAGILGQTPSKAATFNYCANYGAIVAEQSYAAGIGYSLYGNIKANYCYNAGAVNGADGAGAIAPKAQYGANDTANCCLNAGEITSAKKVYQGSNKNTNSFYYSNGELWKMNLEGKKEVVTLSTTEDALALLNGGADADFFVVENDVITVK